MFGGSYQQYGVPIYEAINQALADGVFFEDELDPQQEYDLRGITAHVVMKDNGQPRKVTRLERGR